MRSITAVEIGADTCALASTSVRGAEVYVTAAETLDPASFPGLEAFTKALQQTRKSLKLPRRCRAVVWGLPDGATRKDPLVGPLVEPLTRAGFKVARVVTPCNALGALARLRTSRSGGAMCWLGINRNGVAIIVIRPGKLLYSHSFAWDSNIGASGSQARLLQRYSLVAFLAPEVRRALAVAQQKEATIDGIVTCGNLPDLRSLTMPLIEELDIEVETLDSLEGLQMKPELADRLSEVAPAIRLACAGAFARETRTVDEVKRRRVRRSTRATILAPIAAGLVVAVGAYWWYTRPPTPPGGAIRKAAPQVSAKAAVIARAPAVNPPPAAASSAIPPQGGSRDQGNGTPAGATPPLTAPASAAKAPVTTAAPAASAPVMMSAPAAKPPVPASQSPQGGSRSEGRGTAAGAIPPVTAPAATRPVAAPAPAAKPPVTAPAPAAKPPATVSAPAANAAVTLPVRTAKAPVTTPTPASKPPVTGAVPMPKPSAAGSGTPRTGGSDTEGGGTQGQRMAPRIVNPELPATDKPVAGSAVRAPARGQEPMPELLKDPVPRVTAILVAADRRLATIGDEGQIIGVGDTIGRRVVVAIDDRTVLLREPSGVQIRVALGGRVVAVDRGGR